MPLTVMQWKKKKSKYCFSSNYSLLFVFWFIFIYACDAFLYELWNLGLLFVQILFVLLEDSFSKRLISIWELRVLVGLEFILATNPHEILWLCIFVTFSFQSSLRCDKAGVCLGRKLSPFSDISQNSTLEKQTLHKIQYEKNRLFTKFNSVHVYVFWRAPHLPLIFLEVKNKLFPFLEVKK